MSGTESVLVPAGAGPRIVIDTDGHVLTNYHVIAGAEAVTVTSRDGRHREATIIGEARDLDLALLALVDPTGLVPIAFGSSEALEVGDPSSSTEPLHHRSGTDGRGSVISSGRPPDR